MAAAQAAGPEPEKPRSAGPQPELAGDGIAPAAPKGKRKLILIIAATLLLAGGGGAGAYFAGLFGKDGDEPGTDGAAAHPAAPAITADPVFYSLPDLVVTLNAAERKPRYMKVRVVLAVNSEADAAHVEKLSPRIIDYCQLYLRELRPEELRGTAALVRMREELLRRVNAALAPVSVREVLFTDLFIE